MAIEITIPRLGWSMEEGVFLGWLKGDGDAVLAGEPLFTLQGEKATQDVEAIDAGTLRIPSSAPGVGETVAVGTIIGYLMVNGDGNVAVPTSPVSLPTVRDGLPRISPLARRIAREHGIDWTTLVGSGSSGRIRRVDVLRAVDAKPEPVAPKRPSIPVRSTRRTIAARMIESRRTTAPVTLTTTVDMTNLVGLRQQFKAAEGKGIVVPSYQDFMVKLVALALRDNPHLNARWDEDVDDLALNEGVHVGIAVDTATGLVVPVIRDAPGLGVGQIAERSRELIGRAREGRLRAEDMLGGTFTITNLGAFGIETFTPIINRPECAILGMGKIERRPVMDGERVVGRELMSLSLTFDHRIIDGAPAARFLQQLTRSLEIPAPWLMT
jgi:pyruvate dehydrogenase E2 component (dihydrolipoamide acetyltransferase)